MAFHADDAQATTPTEENAAPVFHPDRNYYCRACGYDLRHLEHFTCPECGRAFDPGDHRTYDTARRGPIGRGLRDLEAVYDKFGPWWDSLSPKRRTVILLAGTGCVTLILARSLETAPLLMAAGILVMLLLQIRSPTRPFARLCHRTGLAIGGLIFMSGWALGIADLVSSATENVAGMIVIGLFVTWFCVFLTYGIIKDRRKRRTARNDESR